MKHKTVTTLDEVIRRELWRITVEMKQHKGFPSNDLRFWPCTKNTRSPMKNAIIKNVEMAYDRCDNWASQIERILDIMK